MPTKVFFCPFACFFSPSEFVSKKLVFNPYGRTGLPFRGKGKLKENKAISAKQGGFGGDLMIKRQICRIPTFIKRLQDLLVGL